MSNPLSAEEQHEEKLRLQKLQEEADLELARETFGESQVLCTACIISHCTQFFFFCVLI